MRDLLLGPPSTDGFGQSLLDDVRFGARLRAAARVAIPWRPPTDAERAAIDAHPIIERFGDWTIAVADHDGRQWIVRERIWHGWPDPPEFAAFALDGDAIWCAADFHLWPRAWTRPQEPVG